MQRCCFSVCRGENWPTIQLKLAMMSLDALGCEELVRAGGRRFQFVRSSGRFGIFRIDVSATRLFLQLK